MAALERDRIGAWWRKPTRAGEQVLVKFGVSVRDQASAAAHLARELPGWDFDAVRAAAESEWQRALGVIEVGGDSRYFHMALRNAMLMPRDRSAEHGGPHWDEFYCSWDIFRTVMPLMTLVKPAMVRGCLASLVDRLDRGGLVTDAFINGQDLIGGMGGEMVDADEMNGGVHASRAEVLAYFADDQPYDTGASLDEVQGDGIYTAVVYPAEGIDTVDSMTIRISAMDASKTVTVADTELYVGD